MLQNDIRQALVIGSNGRREGVSATGRRYAVDGDTVQRGRVLKTHVIHPHLGQIAVRFRERIDVIGSRRFIIPGVDTYLQSRRNEVIRISNRQRHRLPCPVSREGLFVLVGLTVDHKEETPFADLVPGPQVIIHLHFIRRVTELNRVAERERRRRADTADTQIPTSDRHRLRREGEDTRHRLRRSSQESGLEYRRVVALRMIFRSALIIFRIIGIPTGGVLRGSTDRRVPSLRTISRLVDRIIGHVVIPVEGHIEGDIARIEERHQIHVFVLAILRFDGQLDILFVGVHIHLSPFGRGIGNLRRRSNGYDITVAVGFKLTD